MNELDRRAKDNEHTFRDLAALIRRVMNRLMLYQQLPRMYGTGRRLFPAEIHTIDTIGRHPHLNVTTLAAHLGITKGAVSQAIAKLVRKGLVRKTAGRDNGKEVRLELTTRGRMAFANLERHFRLFYEATADYYGQALGPKLTQFQNLFAEFEVYLATLVRQVPIDCSTTEHRLVGGAEAGAVRTVTAGRRGRR